MAATAPPSFLALAGHPLRWQLLTELARSDRRVRELCELVAQPQALVSYHLGKLRSERLVSMRRSIADGRDTYYSLDLARCGTLLTETGAALHPGLAPPQPTASAPRGRPLRLLFLCSAGSAPKPLRIEAVRVMRERGIDIAGRRSKHLDELASQRFDCVITLCDRVREVCPEFPGCPEAIHWSIPDPARDDDPGAFEGVADELAARIPFLLTLVQEAA